MKKRVSAAGFAVIIVSILLMKISAAGDPRLNKTPDPGAVPAEGYVPNAKTAIRIAEAVAEPVYGLQAIRDERPFKARLVDGEWFVKGSIPTNVDWRGGVVEVHIGKTNGCITFLFRGK